MKILTTKFVKIGSTAVLRACVSMRVCIHMCISISMRAPATVLVCVARLHVRGCVHALVRASRRICACVCAPLCLCACVCAFVYGCVCVCCVCNRPILGRYQEDVYPLRVGLLFLFPLIHLILVYVF